jgi:hypothetical protein
VTVLRSIPCATAAPLVLGDALHRHDGRPAMGAGVLSLSVLRRLHSGRFGPVLQGLPQRRYAGRQSSGVGLASHGEGHSDEQYTTGCGGRVNLGTRCCGVSEHYPKEGTALIETRGREGERVIPGRHVSHIVGRLERTSPHFTL